MRCPGYAGFTPRVGESAAEPEPGVTPLSPASPPPAAVPALPDAPAAAPPTRRRGAVRQAAPAVSSPARGERELGRGSASWYGPGFHGRTTANGERFNMHELTAAHKTLPFGTRVLVHNPRNGKQVVVRINDRGPYARGRIIDLSYAAAKAVGLKSRGHGLVVLREAGPKAPRSTRHRRAAPAGSEVDVAEAAGGPSI
ncbi:septal ring lytic transglycosylase RlpA family protein [Comamonadaceae bacterium OH2545_COT-014]|nr:septal ring lytic transglycosylase RlpA family protein [Comamonadaceae bacterium OH2545_COT-014]